ncbi:MAG: hypothetical protein WD053_05015 [Gracilimonas sp.]
MKLKYKFKKNIDLGSLDAESDKLLISAFVEREDIEIVKNTDNLKSILLGRTGSGKTAIIKYLEKDCDNVVRIEPESLSLRHLSNSTIINYFKELDVKLDLFYKLLWKHVFIVELIKLHFKGDLDNSVRILEWIKNQFKNDKKKEAAINYLETWEEKFWENTEYQVREIESDLEKRFRNAVGISGKIQALTALMTKTTDETEREVIRADVITKAQKVINDSQIEEVNSIFKLIKNDLFKGNQKKYYLLIDDLDRDWVSNTIVYDLIKSLIDSIKDFTSLPNTKIIIALRSNIKKKIFTKNYMRGVQREKYANLYLDLSWSKEDLIELINNRLKVIMREEYTQASPKVDDILPKRIKNYNSSIDFILEKTFMRPRDVIDFFNKCIKNADGKTKFSKSILNEATEEYSHERLKALNDEWLENYGQIYEVYSFLKHESDGFVLEDILDKAGNYIINLLTEEKMSRISGELHIILKEFKDKMDIDDTLKKLLIIFHEIGLIGVKINSEKPVKYFYNTYETFDINDLIKETKFYVHPMFKAALKIT